MSEVTTSRDGNAARLEAEVLRLRGELDALHATTGSLARADDLDDVLGAIIRRAVALLPGTDGYLYLRDAGGAMRIRVATGPLASWVGLAVEPGDGVAGKVLATGEPLGVNDYMAWPGRRGDTGRFSPAAVAGVPLGAGEDVVGILGLCYLGEGAFTDDDLSLLDRFARLASVALDRVSLLADLRAELGERTRTEEELLDAVSRLTASEHALRLSHEEMVRRLAAAAEFRDVETGRHVDRVGALCAQIAHRLGLDDSFCESLRLASPLHDVGKIGIPDTVLLKPGPLAPGERSLVERHTEIGYRLLAGTGSELLELAASIALTHHERFDGSGYPRGLAATEIPIEGRIAAVADVFDALTSDRVYRPAFPLDVALELLRDGRGTQFDPGVLDAFFDIRDGAPAALSVVEAGLDEPPVGPAAGAHTVTAPAVSEAARAAAAVLARPGDPTQALIGALATFCETAGAGVIASVYVLDHDRLWCVAQHGYDQVRDGFGVGQGVMGRCIGSGELEFLPDVRTDPAFIGAMKGIVSELAVPIVGRASRCVLNVESVGVPLPPETPGLVEPLLAPLAVAVDAVGAGAGLGLATLARLCVHASCLRGTSSIAEFATRTIGRLLALEAVQLDLSSSVGGPPTSFWRRPSSSLQPIPSARIAAVGATGLDETVLSVLDDPADVGLEDVAVGGLLWLPLRAGGQLVGTIVGRTPSAIELGHEQTEAATLLAQHTAALLDVAQALRREQRAAVTDSLTGLLNRRGFDERLREEVARAGRSGARLALVVADCDDLKLVNDTFGHERGDAVLREVARAMRDAKRVSDVAARIGGDEFALVLPEADADAAASVARRLRERIRTAPAEECRSSLTVGIAVYPEDGATGAALLRAADAKMYARKHAGAPVRSPAEAHGG